MAQRRVLYAMTLAGCLVFYWAYREWLAGFLLTLLVLLPWFSLLVSLPALLTGRLSLTCPQNLTVGGEGSVSWTCRCAVPAPTLRGKLRCRETLSGKVRKINSGGRLPTDHCGMLELLPGRVWACDYLGLFRFPMRKSQTLRIPVRPKPIAPPRESDLSRFYSGALVAKLGGGFAENHELRLYRPGDSLRQIHWKLSAKTGKLILREPMVIKDNCALLTLELAGTPAQIDEKLGRLLYMSRYLLDKEIPHGICCHTGSGLQQFQVSTEPQIWEAVDALLACPKFQGGEAVFPRALWRYHIGGDGHEA